MWILLGDFNAVRLPEERRNSNFNHLSAIDFNNFIDDASLQEYHMNGNKFTFLAGKDKGFKMSKIDRILVCQDFFNREGCVETVNKAFESCSFKGPADVVINKKLNFIRGALRDWWKSVLKKEGEDMAILKYDIERLEKLMEDRDLEEEEIWVWEECKKEMDQLHLYKHRDLCRLPYYI
ncbi:RNA-directed DNA polymerase, eukaryota, Reverse transcriptase zinc-binding domain protein [Artemisia annua]|uniref:RNA-directed DNA polymerase, eukaryota, Reverse transcriptase zinc-binding domain protein n=1 Tax=Artemisia annua TaxID=35608 RepID=A0A2U1KE38_ARTAN|nr:RNA-directed DNA polymerase, eukaryota, Reverse transcriptase zinc-binding domain protein [Artemisia annua]